MSFRSDISEVIKTTARFLTFRSSQAELAALDRRHLYFGLFCTWIVGMGRYWDSHRAELLQYLGVGSLVYVFVLALIIWVIGWPLRPQNWTYERVLTFITLTSPPAILYAIPVERYFDLGTASMLNVYALMVVAAWRVALLVFAMRRMARMTWAQILFAAMLPLIAILTALSFLNLEKAVFNIMAGLRPEEGTSADAAFQIVLGMMFLSWMALPVVLLGYLACVYSTQKKSNADT